MHARMRVHGWAGPGSHAQRLPPGRSAAATAAAGVPGARGHLDSQSCPTPCTCTRTAAGPRRSVSVGSLHVGRRTCWCAPEGAAACCAPAWPPWRGCGLPASVPRCAAATPLRSAWLLPGFQADLPPSSVAGSLATLPAGAGSGMRWCAARRVCRGQLSVPGCCRWCTWPRQASRSSLSMPARARYLCWSP